MKKQQNTKKYLEEIVELAVKIKKPETSNEYPSSINTQAKRALYDNLDKDEAFDNCNGQCHYLWQT